MHKHLNRKVSHYKSERFPVFLVYHLWDKASILWVGTEKEGAPDLLSISAWNLALDIESWGVCVGGRGSAGSMKNTGDSPSQKLEGEENYLIGSTTAKGVSDMQTWEEEELRCGLWRKCHGLSLSFLIFSRLINVSLFSVCP